MSRPTGLLARAVAASHPHAAAPSRALLSITTHACQRAALTAKTYPNRQSIDPERYTGIRKLLEQESFAFASPRVSAINFARHEAIKERGEASNDINYHYAT